jgi:hypothetical protein
MLSEKLESKPCKLGVYINTPTQKHGDERVPAKVLGVKDLLLTKEEFNELMDDKHAWEMLYVEAKGKAAEPFWQNKFAEFHHAVAKFIDSEVTLTFGLKPYRVDFASATIKSVKLDPQTGGLVAMSFTIVCLKSNISGHLSNLDEHLNSSANVTVKFGNPANEETEDDEDQPELNLDTEQSEKAKDKANEQMAESARIAHRVNANVKREKVDTSKRV